jgi:hypothetical protein
VRFNTHRRPAPGQWRKHGTQSDLVLRDSGTGGLQIYNINNNQIRNVNTGGLMLYDIANNQITGSFFLGTVGLDWQYAGVAPIQGSGHIRPRAAQQHVAFIAAAEIAEARHLPIQADGSQK